MLISLVLCQVKSLKIPDGLNQLMGGCLMILRWLPWRLQFLSFQDTSTWFQLRTQLDSWTSWRWTDSDLVGEAFSDLLIIWDILNLVWIIEKEIFSEAALGDHISFNKGCYVGQEPHMHNVSSRSSHWVLVRLPFQKMWMWNWNRTFCRRRKRWNLTSLSSIHDEEVKKDWNDPSSVIREWNSSESKEDSTILIRQEALTYQIWRLKPDFMNIKFLLNQWILPIPSRESEILKMSSLWIMQRENVLKLDRNSSPPIRVEPVEEQNPMLSAMRQMPKADWSTPETGRLAGHRHVR